MEVKSFTKLKNRFQNRRGSLSQIRGVFLKDVQGRGYYISLIFDKNGVVNF